LAVALGAIGLLLSAAQPARAGITLNVTSQPSNTSIAPVTLLVGTDPATNPQIPGVHQISFTAPGQQTVLGPNTFLFQSLSLVQSYTPVIGPTGIINSALGDSTTVQLRNLNGPAATLTITVAYDSFNFPTGNPLSWTSAFAATRLDGGATISATESVTSSGGGGTISHPLLTSVGADSRTILVSPSRPFTVTQVFTLFLPSGANASFEKSDTLSNAVPEPASLAMIASALPLIGLGAWTRRRKAQV